MARRFTWIFPLLIGATITSFFWWQSSQRQAAYAAIHQGEEVGTETSPELEALLQTEGNQDSSREGLNPDPANAGARVALPRKGTQAATPDNSARLQVQLVDATTGSPMAGVRVVAYLENPPQGKPLTTRSTDQMRGSLLWNPTSNEQGLVEFDLPPSLAVRISVRPDPAHHKPLIERVPALNPFETRDLRLAVRSVSYTPYHGLVRNRQTGHPVHGARVRIFHADSLATGAFPAQSEGLPDALSEVQGTFQLDASESGAIAWIQASGLNPTLIALDAAHSTPTQPREVYLSPGGSLAVQLRSHDQSKLGKVRVVVSASSYSLLQNDSEGIPNKSVEWESLANSFGRVEFANLPSDTPLNISLRMPDSQQADSVLEQPPMQILAPGEAREMKWTVGGGTRLVGVLSGVAELPLAGQEMWLLPASSDSCKLATTADGSRALHKVHTDPTGRFVFSGVPAGAWWVTPASNGTRTVLAPLARRFDVPENLEVLEVAFEVFPALWVQGKVLLESGESAGRKPLWLHSSTVPGKLVGWSLEDGSFRLGPLAPGLVEMGVRPTGGQPGSTAQVCAAGDTDVRIRISQTAKLHTVLSTKDGSAVPEIERILLTHPDGTVTAEPTLELVDLPRGTYAISVLSVDGRVASAHRVSNGAGVSATEALLQFSEGSRVHLKGPGQYRLWTGGACVAFGQLADGETAIEIIPTGTFRLERPDQTKPSEPLTVEQGKPVHIDLSRSSAGPGLAPTRPPRPLR